MTRMLQKQGTVAGRMGNVVGRLKALCERMGLLRRGSLAWAQRCALAGGLSCIAIALSGCNTTEGFGRDIESAGAGLEDAADDAKD
ncbi:MAG: entericidin A/B family lipoprotein [Planctomycetota bacterium]|nr:entericidin A/B family lipoprotein [Planctomycetota bacterium]